jgi:predicted metal-binding protein
MVLCTVCKLVSESIETCRDIYDNISQLLHQVGISHHFHIQTVICRTLQFCTAPQAHFIYSEMCKYIFDNAELHFFYFSPHHYVQLVLGSFF